MEHALLSRYRGAGVVVNEKLEILEIVGQGAQYLALPAGKITLNLLKLLPETGLFLEVEKLVREAEKNGEAIRRDRIPYRSDGTSEELNVEAIPLGTAQTRSFLVLFEPASGLPGNETAADSDPRDLEIARLKHDLVNVRQRLLTAVEDHQRSDEESQSAACETLSANEELQSLNEELETAKEELQSINEELATVNQELVSNNAALTIARDFARSIIETDSSPLLVLDTELRIDTANAAFYRMFDIDSREVEGRLLYSVSNGCWGVPRLREMLESVLPDNKTVHGFEIEQDFPGVGHKVLMLSARQLDGLQRVLVNIEDVTEMKGRADAKLRESEKRFSNIADAAPVMIWVSGLDKGCTFFNKPWLEFTGRTLHQELGNGWAASVHPEDLARCMSTYWSAFDARQAFQIEYRLQREDGEYRWVLNNGIPRIDAEGIFSGYIGSCVDITDLKSKQVQDLARRKLETVGTLAEGIVHDFNNLLGGILANTELALTGLAHGLKPVEELYRIRDAALRGAEIVRQLMVFAGRENEVFEAVNISGLVEDMVELLKVSVSKHATVETRLRRDLPAVRANPSQIRQLVMNLITNASEAIGDRDGVIKVTTKKVTVSAGSSQAIPESLPSGDYVQLEVSDTGRGMTPEVQSRIFDPFFTTKLTGSHGHGLIVVQRILQRLRGAVKISSVPGKGTTFRVFLPGEVVTATALNPIAASASDTLKSSQATILLVDDEELLRLALAKILRRHGLSIIEAGDGSAAMEVMRARRDEIDLLLLDITLPGTSSRLVYEEAKRIKPELPVIIISAKSEEMAGASLATSVENFLRKPFLSADLIEKIQKILTSRPNSRAAGSKAS